MDGLHDLLLFSFVYFHRLGRCSPSLSQLRSGCWTMAPTKAQERRTRSSAIETAPEMGHCKGQQGPAAARRSSCWAVEWRQKMAEDEGITGGGFESRYRLCVPEPWRVLSLCACCW